MIMDVTRAAEVTNANLTRTLRRIRQIIAETVRSYQCSRNISERPLRIALTNLQRISVAISEETYNNLYSTIADLLQIPIRNRNLQNYTLSRSSTGRKGRPSLEINNEIICLLYNEGCTASSIANQLGCSQSTIYKKLYEFGMPMRARYSQISDNELKEVVSQIHEDHPNAGYIMMLSYLKARDIVVPRSKVRKALSLVDPIGTASRWSQSVKRRTYKVSSPNALWHMDAHLKLSR
ncbi:hypothetical protein FQR65_LT04382 [Abscondita terminalis]|nr:hypothetical protein FQR65_LT04382 [Abscondita terminalis]